MADGLPVARLKKIEGLLGVLMERHQQCAALIEEITELLGGGAGIAAQMKEFEGAFEHAWTQRYHGQRYLWRYVKDRPQTKRLLKTLGLDELTLRAARYIANEDPFLTRERHPFGLFVSGINRYAAESDGMPLYALGSPAVGCTHVPRCTSDIEHTGKRSADMRVLP